MYVVIKSFDQDYIFDLTLYSLIIEIQEKLYFKTVGIFLTVSILCNLCNWYSKSVETWWH